MILHIRRQQMKIMQLAADADFRRRVAAALSAGDHFIDSGIVAALRFGIDSETDVFQFLCIIHRWLPERDVALLSRASMNCLYAHGISGTKRLAALELCLEAESRVDFPTAPSTSIP
jgi:hypothetical protein